MKICWKYAATAAFQLPHTRTHVVHHHHHNRSCSHTISLEIPLTTRFWQAAPAPVAKFPVTRAIAEPTGEVKMDVGPPVLVVDLTDISNGTLHNRFDKFACNDPEAKAALSKQIAAGFDSYLTNAELLQRGVVHVRCSYAVR